MVYSEAAGPGEAACLVFAINAKEAQRLAWQGCESDLFEKWIDVARMVDVITASRMIITDRHDAMQRMAKL